MRSILSLLLVGIYVCAANAGSVEVGCGGKGDSVATHLLGSVPLVGRRLLANWKPCNEQDGKRITGKFMKQIPNIGIYRGCCVECKKAPECIGWSFSRQSKVCKLFAQGASFTQLKSTGYLSGMLTYKFNSATQDANDGSGDPLSPADPNLSPSPPSDGGEPDNSGLEPTPEPTPNPNPTPEPTPSPSPPLTDMLQNKVLYGRRINSYMPCRGNTANTPEACASQCTGNKDCNAWTFAANFNCGWVGQSQPEGLCYLMSDVARGDMYDAPEGETFFSGFTRK